MAKYVDPDKVVGGRIIPPTPPQVRRTHPPLGGTLQTVAEGGVPRGEVEDPPTDVALAVSGIYCTEHVVHGGDPTGVGMICPGPNPKRYHQHTGHGPAREHVEGGGGADRHTSKFKNPVA